jgi:serine protease
MPDDRSLFRATVLSGLLMAHAALAVSAPNGPRAARMPSERPAQGLIVRMTADAKPADWDRMNRVAGLTGSAARERGPRSRVIGANRLLGSAEARELAQRLSREPGVAWVEPNTRERRLQAMVAPNDPFFTSGQQWWLKPVGGSDSNVLADRLRGVPGIQTAWSQSTGSAGSVIAVLDTGYTAHPELQIDGRLIKGYDFVSEVEYANDGSGRDGDASDPGDWVSSQDRIDNPGLFDTCEIEPSSWHGTIIAGQLAGRTDNSAGVAAMQWAGKVVAVRVAGKCGATVTDIVDGMRWAAGLPVNGAPSNPNPARVITISFGGDGACSREYQDAINDVRAAGAVVVAAAGNENGKVLRPAKCPGVIGVGAVNRDGFKTTYSNFGPEVSITTVGGDPGTDSNGNPFGSWGPLLGDSGLLTVYNLGRTIPGASGYAYVFGTSFSTPIVAGAASLMLAVNPALTADQLAAGLRASARPHVTSPLIGSCSDLNPGRCICTTSTCGAGLLDVDEALRYAVNPAAYSPPARIGAVIGKDNPEVVAAAALGADLPPNSVSPPPGDSGGGGSGGALGWPWLLALALAVWAAWRSRRTS